MRRIIFLISIFSCLVVTAQQHQWERTNPGGGGAFSNVKAGPTGIVIAGSDLSGAYRSLDRGETWDVIGASRGLTKTHVSGIGFSTDDPNIIFLGTTGGIFRSGDAGETFSLVMDDGYVNDIIVAKSNPDIVYAACHSAWNTKVASIQKSTNKGLFWFQVSEELPSRRILKLDVCSNDENKVYFLTGKGRGACGEAELYRSYDGGAGWERIGEELGVILDFEIHPGQPNVIYATTMHADCSAQWYYTDRLGELYRSEDGGDTWTLMSERTGIIWLDPEVANLVRLIDPRNTEDWNDNSGTWTSMDKGVTWTKTGLNAMWTTGFQQSAYGTPFDGICKALGEDLSNANNMYWVDHQWVYGSFDQGNNFEHLNTNEITPGWWRSRGFDNVNMMDMEINLTDPDIIYAAYFDIGLWRSLDHGDTWQSCNQDEFTGSWHGEGGNTISVVSDPIETNVVWATMSQHQKGNSPTYLVRSDNFGAKGSWVLSNNGLPDSEVMGLSLDENSTPGNRTLFAIAEGEVYRSTNQGADWALVLADVHLWYTAVDHFDSDIVYAGGGSGFWRSADGGDTWMETGLEEMQGTEEFWGWGNGEGVFDICCSRLVPGVVYVTAYGEEKGCYKSADYGESWVKLYTDKYMRKVAESPLSRKVVYITSSKAMTSGGYIGESMGVLYSEDGGETFTQVNEGMAWPFAHTVNLDIDGYVFVGSPGTGFQKAMVPFISGTNTLSNEVLLCISPNPVSTTTTLSGIPNNATIIIYDLSGKVVLSTTFKKPSIKIDLSQLKSGIYLLNVSNTYTKVIKQ